jgi:glycosyltransferase involved in cell wall biosynthesis
MNTGTPVRRDDLTPCLLFPELIERGGGLARAVLERASLYAEHYEQVVILTTGFSPRIDTVIAELKQRGSLHERVSVRNFFQHSTWVTRLGVPPTAELSVFDSDQVVSKRQRMPGGEYLRIADRNVTERHPFGYRYFDQQGRPLVTTRTSPDSKHEQRATFHQPKPREVGWARTVAEWVDEELSSLANPVLFSLQRGFNDPVLLASKRAVRKIVSLHNCQYNDPEDPSSGIRPSFRPLLFRPRAVDEIICLTEQQRQELERELPGAALRSIPYPGRAPREEPTEKDPSLVVLVAQLIDRKRVDHAIRAFATVVESVPEARLEIYGEGPAEPELRRLVDELGLSGSVALMGYSRSVDRAQGRAVCTLLTSTFEGYGRVIAESMTLGTPVIAYDVRYGPRDLIRHEIDGLLVDVHRPEALARAIVGLLREPQRAVEMGARARELAERYPVEPYERAWLDVVSGRNQPKRSRPASPRHLAVALMRQSDLAYAVRGRLRRRPGRSKVQTAR